MFDWDDDQDQENNDEAKTSLRSSEQPSGSKNDILGVNQDSNSTFMTSEELTAAQLDVDSWPDLPLSNSLGKVYSDACNRETMGSQLMLDVTGTADLDKIRVQLDSPAEIFDNDKDDKENDSFLDCDWADIGDIEDLDEIFSGNDSIFGHEMVSNAGEFLTASSDVISSTVQSIPLPDKPLSKDQPYHFLIPVDLFDMPLSQDQPSGYYSSSSPLDELSAGKETLEEMTGDSTVRTRSEYYEARHLFSDKLDIPNRSLTSHKKSEEKGKTKDLEDTSAMWSCSTNESQQLLSSTTDAHTKTPMKSFQLSAERQVTDDIGQLDSPNQFLSSEYANTAYPFPTIPISQNVYAKRDQGKPLSGGHELLADFSKHPNALSRPSDLASRPLTPQEKIEKLKRRQKIQAMLAIQQQQQKFAHPSTNDSGVPKAFSPKKQPVESRTTTAADLISSKLLSPEKKVLVDQEEPWRISSMIDGHSLEETMYYQLQDAIGQLDIRIRLCIRDSLFRLAQSAMERQSASDRSSANKSNRDEDELSEYDDTKRLCRHPKWTDAETGTNPIDRTVAHLLFHRPSELLTMVVKEEMPQLPVVYNPAPNASSRTVAHNSDDYPEMEGQPSKQSEMY